MKCNSNAINLMLFSYKLLEKEHLLFRKWLIFSLIPSDIKVWAAGLTLIIDTFTNQHVPINAQG